VGARTTGPTDRMQDRWSRPPEYAAGWKRAFVIIVPDTAVVWPPVDIKDAEEIVWIDPPAQGNAIFATVLLSARGATAGLRGFSGATGDEDAIELVTVLDLKNGERVWVLAHEEPTPVALRTQRQRARDAANDDPTLDQRLFGRFDEGLRFFLDAGPAERATD
jgi:hypothetical protein